MRDAGSEVGSGRPPRIDDVDYAVEQMIFSHGWDREFPFSFVAEQYREVAGFVSRMPNFPFVLTPKRAAICMLFGIDPLFPEERENKDTRALLTAYRKVRGLDAAHMALLMVCLDDLEETFQDARAAEQAMASSKPI